VQLVCFLGFEAVLSESTPAEYWSQSRGTSDAPAAAGVGVACDFYQTATMGLKTASDTWLTALTIRGSRFPLAYGDIFLYTDL